MKGVTSMKKFIFRRPFVTKKDKVIARSLMESSEKLFDKAQSEIAANNGTVTLNATLLIQRSADFMNCAAKRLGFSSLYDMNKYIEKHGRL